ncbi:MAG TPA: VWA domain-containing protein [Vicinamibacterales bacterium]
MNPRVSERRAVRASVTTALVVCSILAAPVHTQQQQPAPQRAEGVLRDNVTAVLVDVVVRDRRGQPVRDLAQSDFEVIESGVAQPIGSFLPVFEQPTGDAAKSAHPAASAAASAIVNPGPGVTALVFDRLRPEARRIAAQAARSYMGSKEESADFVAVFGIDLGLTAYVPFTRNAVALRRALDAMVISSSNGPNTAEARRAVADAMQQAETAARASNQATATATGPGAAAAIGTAPATALLAAMQASIVSDFQAMDQDQQGYATTTALLAIVRSLGRIPGRKSLVLFSEGLSIPDAVQRFYLGVIDAANRANVSIYTMDAVGLRAQSDTAQVRDAVNMAAAGGINSGYSADGVMSDAYTRNLEGNSTSLRSDPAYTLGELASATGGLFFNNTNNLAPAFDRVENDLRNYYLLGYTPTNTTYDGKFRTIEVKVKRPGVTISARKGYFAVRDPGGVAVNSWEVPALAALEQKPVGNAFPIRAGAMLFPERGRPGLVPIVVDLKTAPLTFQAAADGKTYTSDFTVLVRFVDQVDPRGSVVRKVSQHYEIKGPIDQMERAKNGEVLFYRESELPPGLYTMESIVYDALSGKSSVRFSSVEIPKQAEGTLRASSLVLVKRSERVPEKEQRADHPLMVKDAILHPNLGDPISKASKELGFYFVVYPAPDTAATESRLELLQNGKLVAQLPMPLSAPDTLGRVQQVGRLPLAQLAPDTYELRVIITQGTTQVVRSAMVRLTE